MCTWCVDPRGQAFSALKEISAERLSSCWSILESRERRAASYGSDWSLSLTYCYIYRLPATIERWPKPSQRSSRNRTLQTRQARTRVMKVVERRRSSRDEVYIIYVLYSLKGFKAYPPHAARLRPWIEVVPTYSNFVAAERNWWALPS